MNRNNFSLMEKIEIYQNIKTRIQQLEKMQEQLDQIAQKIQEIQESNV